MNIGRGLFRSWIFISVIWIIGMAASIYAVSPFDFVGSRWGYEHQMRDKSSKQDGLNPYYKDAYSLSAKNLKPSFHKVGYQSFEAWDKSVKEGGRIIVEMPDKSSLYLYTAMTKEDQLYLARAFWDRRWLRYADMGKYWLAGLVGPPLALLVLGWSLLWVGRGFKSTRN